MKIILNLFLLRELDEIESLKEEQTRLIQQSADAQRREKILMRRLANKEQEFQDYVVCQLVSQYCIRYTYANIFKF